MKYKLLVLDLDGTLTNNKKEITEHYDELYPINGSTYRTKKHIIGLYKSQSFILVFTSMPTTPNFS